jgi:transcriptional regulator with GAF, ATPase, and Fis domain
LAQGFLEVQPVNGFHQDVESQSTIHSNGSVPVHDVTSRLLSRPGAFSTIVYASRAMDEVVNKMERARDSSAPMLITGETGVGKELIARAAYSLSPRHGREFIPFNCGDVTPELIASELFGYRRGAFTGADRDHKGVIREADGATLLLDEIGELPLAAQSKLLRFLQEGEVRPSGEARPFKVDVRVIAATNRGIEADVRSGRFREDLYYRLNVFRVHIPPLRERREDICPLIEHFLTLRHRETGKRRLRLSDDAWELLLGYHWPGNVRQVKNVVHLLAASTGNDGVIGPERVLEEIGGCPMPPAASMVENRIVIDSRLSYREAKNELEKLFIGNALNETGGNLSHAAAMMGMSVFGLRKAVKRLGIEWRKDNHK